MGQRVLRPTGALARALAEVTHHGCADWSTWCDRVREQIGQFAAERRAIVAVLRHDAGGCAMEAITAIEPELLTNIRERSAEQATRPGPRYRLRYIEVSAAGLQQRCSCDCAARLIAQPPFAAHRLAVAGSVDERTVLILTGERPASGRATRRLSRLALLAAHLEAVLRLRLHPEQSRGVLSATTLGCSHEPNLKAKARRDLWQRLRCGQQSLVRSAAGHDYLVLDTVGSAKLRALTLLEAQVVEMSASSLTGKAVSYALGLSEARVSHALTAATLKLGIPNRVELLRLVSGLLGLGKAEAHAMGLTDAESEVLSLVSLGWTNAGIAFARGRSQRTVANQVSSLLRKLALPSRRALALATPSLARLGHLSRDVAPEEQR